MVAFWHFTHHYVPAKTVPAWGVLSILEEGHTGVSLFCVVSGFIFAYLYADKAIRYGGFLRKRLLRIAPLFVVTLALSLYITRWDEVQLFAMMVTTLHLGRLPAYFTPGWSLLIEWQFYLLFPFLMLFARQFGPRYLFGLVVLFLAVRWLVMLDRQTVHEVAYFSIFGRIDQFLCGMLVGLAMKEPAWRARFEHPVLSVAGALLSATAIVAFYWWFDARGGFYDFDGGPYPVKGAIWVYLPTIEAVLYSIMLGCYFGMPALPGTRSLSAAVGFVGLISYSMYLDQLMVFGAVHALIAQTSLVAATWEDAARLCALVGLPALIVVASATYFLIERPFLKMKDATDSAAPIAGAQTGSAGAGSS